MRDQNKNHMCRDAKSVCIVKKKKKISEKKCKQNIALKIFYSLKIFTSYRVSLARIFLLLLLFVIVPLRCALTHNIVFEKKNIFSIQRKLFALGRQIA